jgi:bifunctional DNase/RNase
MEGSRTLPIIIGAFEAQSIAIALEKEIRPPRPLTHDLFKTFSDRFSIEIKEVIIHKLVDGVFFSSLVCEKDGVEEIIDARTSDAIAIAVRFQAVIYTYENILDKAGVYLKTEEQLNLNDPSEIQDISLDTESLLGVDKESSYSKLSIAELNVQLDKAVSDENYELAAKIRDEISQRF